LGSVRIELGASEAPVIAELKKEFDVRGLDGGWEVRSGDLNDERVPLVGITTKDGHIRAVTFKWGPGVTLRLEAMAEHLAHALPAEGDCQIRNTTRPFEGGTLHTLAFQCGSTTVSLQTGVWPQGNTASIDVRMQEE
jgi:hypothetical protein